MREAGIASETREALTFPPHAGDHQPRRDARTQPARPGDFVTEALLVLMAVIWAVNYTVAKFGTRTVPPLAYNAVRIVMAVVALLIIAWLGSHERPTRAGSRSHCSRSACLGTGSIRSASSKASPGAERVRWRSCWRHHQRSSRSSAGSFASSASARGLGRNRAAADRDLPRRLRLGRARDERRLTARQLTSRRRLGVLGILCDTDQALHRTHVRHQCRRLQPGRRCIIRNGCRPSEHRRDELERRVGAGLGRDRLQRHRRARGRESDLVLRSLQVRANAGLNVQQPSTDSLPSRSRGSCSAKCPPFGRGSGQPAS